MTQFQQAHQQWVEDALSDEVVVRDHRWSEAIAVGSLGFLESVKAELGSEALHRGVEQFGGAYALREHVGAFLRNHANGRGIR